MAPIDIQLPPYHGQTVKVSVINGARAHMLSAILVDPAPTDQKYLNLANYSFLIESENRNQKVIFDLAFMKGLGDRMPPALKGLFAGEEEVMGIDEFTHVPDAIQAGGLDLKAINSVVWSHVHLDHVGDPSVFPSSTELVVGPGLKAQHVPGYPKNPTGVVLDSAFEGRKVREVDFTASDNVIGGFRAVDFFEDGSFWLLETPGHVDHHISALCRTTEDSWVFLGGDVCHNAAQLRPNSYRPLPESVPASILGRTPPPHHCTCSHMSHFMQRTKGGAFYDQAPAMQENIEKARETLEKLKAFDGREDVLTIIAHDATLLDVLDFYPKNINEWRAKDWASQSRWAFLKDFDDVAAASS